MHVGLSAGALQGRSVRLGLVYGPAPVMKVDYRFMTAPNKFCLQVARGEELSVWGESRLGLIHVDDAARALLLAADPALGEYAPVNAASEVTIVPEVARLVAEVAAKRGLSVRITPDLPAARRPVETMPSTLHGLGFRPRHDLRDGLASTLDYFLARIAGPPGGAPGAGGDGSV